MPLVQVRELVYSLYPNGGVEIDFSMLDITDSLIYADTIYIPYQQFMMDIIDNVRLYHLHFGVYIYMDITV